MFNYYQIIFIKQISSVLNLMTFNYFNTTFFKSNKKDTNYRKIKANFNNY